MIFLNLKKKIGTFIKISLISLFFIILIDFLFGNLILKIIKNDEKKPYIKHEIYHHTLKKNFNDLAKWDIEYHYCTDSNGFKSACNTIPTKIFDLAFIGDSFTEGVGLPYEKTFVGIIANSNKKLKIANLGVTSYSPSIYLLKFKELLKEGYKFKHLIIYVDVSDMYDEGKKYRIYNNKIFTMKPLYLEKFQDSITWSFPFISHTVKKIKNRKTRDDSIVEHNGCSYLEKCFQRGNWTYVSNKFEKKATDKSIQAMNEIYQLAKENNIKLSISVYPWPGMLIYDKKDSKHVKMWNDFCEKKCDNFINNFPEFFEHSKKYGYQSTIDKFYIKGDVHFNEAGNLLIANKFIKNFKF